MKVTIDRHQLQGYRDIAKLFFKYGRGDLLAGSEFGSGALDDHDTTNSGSSMVHDRPGDVLRAQRRIDTGKHVETKTTRPDAQPDAATSRADELADDLEAMGPTYVKVGQFLSTRADLLPAPYLEALSRLQDRVGPISYSEVERVVTEDLGVRVTKAFAEFETEPVAAASLGQVHRARLRDGTLVAVKVQRPDIRERIERDLEILAKLADLLDRHTDLGRRQGFTPMLETFKRSLMKEIDYRQEARNLAILGENLASLKHIQVPQPVPDYVTTHVLTMDFVSGRKVTSLGPLAKTELDAKPLAEELCRAYLKQVLVDGFFHADPHPGNIFLTDDGRLALIDLGMVAQIPAELQEDLLKLVLAIGDGRGEDASHVVLKIGTPVGESDAETIRREVGLMVTEFQGLRLRDIALGRLIFDAARVASENGYRMPQELTMLGKALLNVDEVARRLDPDFDPNASIQRNASDIMRQRMIKSMSPGKLFAGMLEAKEFVEHLPRRLNQLVDAITENRVRVKVDAIDETLLMEGLQKIANRITLGLVISALIVGAALLMRIDTSFRIFGYPGLAILFFLVAALSGVMLVGNIMVKDMRADRERLKERARGTSGGAPR